MAARQLSSRRRADPRNPRRPAAGLLSAVAEAGRRAVRRLSARVRPGLGLRRPYRQPLRPRDAVALRARLPARPAADDRRAVGGGDHAAHRPGGESAALGRADHEPPVRSRRSRFGCRPAARRERPARRSPGAGILTSRRRSPKASPFSSSSGCAIRIPRRRRRWVGWKRAWGGKVPTPTNWCAGNISCKAPTTSRCATSSPACG